MSFFSLYLDLWVAVAKYDVNCNFIFIRSLSQLRISENGLWKEPATEGGKVPGSKPWGLGYSPESRGRAPKILGCWQGGPEVCSPCPCSVCLAAPLEPCLPCAAISVVVRYVRAPAALFQGTFQPEVG